MSISRQDEDNKDPSPNLIQHFYNAWSPLQDIVGQHQLAQCWFNWMISRWRCSILRRNAHILRLSAYCLTHAVCCNCPWISGSIPSSTRSTCVQYVRSVYNLKFYWLLNLLRSKSLSSQSYLTSIDLSLTFHSDSAHFTACYSCCSAVSGMFSGHSIQAASPHDPYQWLYMVRMYW